MKKLCDVCKKELDEKNTADGVNGYEIREVIPEAPGVTRAKAACKECYVSFREAKYGKAPKE